MGFQNIVFLRRSNEAVNEFPDIPVYDQLGKAMTGTSDILMICTPAPFHLELASRAIEGLCHVFIEKPLSHDWRGVETFLEKAEKQIGKA